jgi:hypothetical protein
MNASISSDNDDGVREIAALNLVSAKDIDSYSLKWIETRIGFVGMEYGSDAHSPIVNNRLYFRFKISDSRLKSEGQQRQFGGRYKSEILNFSEDFCGESFEQCAFLPCVGWMAGFYAGLREERFLIPAPLECDLWEEKATASEVGYDESV